VHWREAAQEIPLNKAAGSMRIERQAKRAITRLKVAPGERILIAVSGGADSVALLHLMNDLQKQFGFEVAAAHFNHHLRGAESDRDARFVRELCLRLDVRLVEGHAATLGESTSNIEERAREARYAFLRDAAKEIGATRIALGHHRDDQAETVMMRLLRGAGAAGLRGMAVAEPGKSIRPLLQATRSQILGYLSRIGASFVTDGSNESTDLLRNRVRHELLPLIEREYVPGFSQRLAELAESMRDLDSLVTDLGRGEMRSRLNEQGEMDLAGFAEMNPALESATIRALIEARVGTLRRIGRTHIETLRRLCTEGPNGSIDLPWGWRARRSYQRLSLCRRCVVASETQEYEAQMLREGTTVIAGCRYRFDSAVLKRETVWAVVPPDRALFDAERIGAGLRVRNFRAGDRIRPIGMAGARKVKKIFIEQRVPLELRYGFPMVTLDEEVAWMPGLKRGSVALIGSDTRWVMQVEARLQS